MSKNSHVTVKSVIDEIAVELVLDFFLMENVVDMTIDNVEKSEAGVE